MIVVDSKDNLQDPNVRTEAIAGTNLFGFKHKTSDSNEIGMSASSASGAGVGGKTMAASTSVDHH